MINRLVKQLLGQRYAAWHHACGHRSRDLLLLCSYGENEIISFAFALDKCMKCEVERTRVMISHYRLMLLVTFNRIYNKIELMLCST